MLLKNSAIGLLLKGHGSSRVGKAYFFHPERLQPLGDLLLLLLQRVFSQPLKACSPLPGYSDAETSLDRQAYLAQRLARSWRQAQGVCYS